jgi:hypothetical protein
VTPYSPLGGRCDGPSIFHWGADRPSLALSRRALRCVRTYRRFGLEREIRQKSAGQRTYTIVGFASYLILLVSKYGFTNSRQRSCRLGTIACRRARSSRASGSSAAASSSAQGPCARAHDGSDDLGNVSTAGRAPSIRITRKYSLWRYGEPASGRCRMTIESQWARQRASKTHRLMTGRRGIGRGGLRHSQHSLLPRCNATDKRRAAVGRSHR